MVNYLVIYKFKFNFLIKIHRFMYKNFNHLLIFKNFYLVFMSYQHINIFSVKVILPLEFIFFHYFVKKE